ncbi:thiol-disulfide isomerase/thioredoxin [Pedobacter sp. W3I1]|uniref:TlpA family protein disulfide reductase n=1 Tax=Pedobacter sp. W3I1 TaxID=3042291 RepID=UPI002781FFE8|nr:thioredoxin family protein [Pedobacter sp. W3I1]MDQ0641754.1 thiol-disulfide isomerase/thioredoxin [Pedobacter sp. W3I1]
MKKQLYLLILLASLFSACDPAPATFNLETKNFGPNAVITIQSAENGKTLKVENITNTNQTFKINMPVKGYAIIRAEDGSRKGEYYFYLDKGTFKGVLDGKNINSYPLKSVPTEEGEQFINYYGLKDYMSKSLLDSLDIVELELDQATKANIMERAKKADVWREKKILLQLDIIKAFAKKYPGSTHTLFLLEQLGRADSEAKHYLSIFNSLDKDIQESKKGKSLLEEIKQASQMMAGSKMPNIEGENPEGKKFNSSILKKVNLVICWTSYSGKSRKNNQVLVKLYEKYKNKDVEFIGVSLDKKRDWWVNVIKDDHLTWPQYSDLQGAKSPNAKNLSNYNITYFFLVDKSGTVLSNNDLSLDFVDSEISKNLAGR